MLVNVEHGSELWFVTHPYLILQECGSRNLWRDTSLCVALAYGARKHLSP
eukprot:COSAG05_NODE_2589_length_2868_cov_1.239075_4_plen_50_part_00